MNTIGDWAVIFSKLSLSEYLETSPPAVLIMSSETGSYKVQTDDPGLTLFRMEPDEQLKRTLFADDDGDARDRAYYVLPIGPAEKPEGALRLSLGCTEESDLQLEDASVSREHAFLGRDGDTYTIEDAGSTLGTKIEGKRLPGGQRRELTSGETVLIGEVEMTFLEPIAFYRFVDFFMKGKTR